MGFSTVVTKGGGNTEKVPAGNHPAVIVAVLECGQQHRQYGSDPAKWVKEICLVWELPTKRKTTGETHLMGECITQSADPKATFYKYYLGMKGVPIPFGPFDYGSLLGTACMLQIVHKGEKGYPKVAGVAEYPEGLPAPVPTRKGVCLGLDDYRARAEYPEWLPWQYSKALEKMCPIPEFIGACKEIAGDRAPLPAPAAADPVPF